MAANPQTVTIYGRLSWPVWTMAQAIERNKTSKYPKADDRVAPSFNLLVEQDQLDKLIKHVETEFLPWVEERGKSGEKRNALSTREIKKIKDLLSSRDWEDQPPFIPIKVVPEKSRDLAPETVASVPVGGQAGRDLVQKAIVRNEDQLVDPASVSSFPAVLPLEATTLSLYGGCIASATLNLYAFTAAGSPGFSASATTVVFREDADSFSGSIDVDEEDMLLDD